MTRTRDAILRELADADATLADIERTRDQMETRIQALRAELATASTATDPSVSPALASSATAPQTPADKEATRASRPTSDLRNEVEQERP